MDADNSQSLRQIVSAALELPATEREAHLRRSCPPELLDEALELVSFADDAEITRQLDRRLASAAARLAEPSPPRIEGYEVLERVGDGGMGVVFRARQTGALDREVALKVIRRDWGGTDFSARFAAESRAIGRMAHPNIAAVHDAGTTADGTAWFAMEYVDGKPLREYCDEQRLSVRDRLELFLELCRGVQHAHQKGIIHRDLKSSNVLVSTTAKGGPIPKIIDFGIAKAIEGDTLSDAPKTIVGQIIGTPEYMSPERLRGEEDIDIRCDVYSLGVILYELICGKLPFDRATTRRIGHSDREESEAKRPSTQISKIDEVSTGVARQRGASVRKLQRQLRGELDWITLKALASSPEDRYASTLELVQDVQAYLDGAAVSVGPASLSYQLRKFGRRHRIAIFTSNAIILSLAIGLFVANRQRIIATNALEQAESVTEFLTGMLREVQPEVGDKDVTVREILQGAARRLKTDEDTAPSVKARLFHTIGDSYYSLSRWDDALGAYGEAVELYRNALGVHAPETLDARNDLARVYKELNRFEEAEAELLSVREELVRKNGETSEEALSAEHDLASLYQSAGRLDEAENSYRRELEGALRGFGEDSQQAARAKGGLGNLLLDRNEIEEAAQLMQEEVDILTRIHGAKDVRLMSPYNNLAFARFSQDQPAVAESLIALTLEIRKEQLGPEHDETMASEINLAWLREYNGDYEGARELLEGVLARATANFAEDAEVRVTAMNNLGFLLLDKFEEYDRAEELTEEAIAIRMRVLGPTHINSLISRNNLGLLYEKTGRLEEAEELHAELLELRRETLGEDHPHTQISRENLERVRKLRQ